jgi:hypothetical protein
MSGATRLEGLLTAFNHTLIDWEYGAGAKTSWRIFS